MKFEIPKDKLKKMRKWMNGKEYRYCGAIGGRYSYIFSPTTLGTIIKVKDDVTGDEIDLTEDYDW